MKERLLIIDILKILCAFVIFYGHSGDLLCFEYSRLINMRCAVEVFFVLSGFVAAISYKGEGSVTDVMKKRINKFYPIYFLTLLFGCLYMFCCTNLSIFSTIVKIPIHLFLLQTIFPVATTAFNGASWYLSCLLWVTFAFLLLQKKIDSLKKWLIFEIIYFVVLCGLRYVFYSEWLFYHSPLTRLFDFLLGVIAAKGVVAMHNLKYSFNKNIFIVGVILSLFFILFCFYNSEQLLCGLFVVVCLLCFSCLQIKINKKIVDSLCFLSDASFDFYMFHYLVILFTRFLLGEFLNVQLITVMSFIITVLCVYVYRKFNKCIKKIV